MLMLPGCAAGMHCSGPQLEFAYSIFIARNNRTWFINYQLSWAVFGLIFGLFLVYYWGFHLQRQFYDIWLTCCKSFRFTNHKFNIRLRRMTKVDNQPKKLRPTTTVPRLLPALQTVATNTTFNIINTKFIINNHCLFSNCSNKTVKRSTALIFYCFMLPAHRVNKLNRFSRLRDNRNECIQSPIKSIMESISQPGSVALHCARALRSLSFFKFKPSRLEDNFSVALCVNSAFLR